MAFSSSMRTIPVLAVSFVVAIGIIFGRLVCAFVCPFGLVQDLIHKIPSPKFKLWRQLNYMRYVLLILLVFVFPYAFGLVTSGYLAVKREAEEIPGGVTEVRVTVENPDIVPVEGVTLEVKWLDKETKEDVWVDNEPHVFEDVVVPPGGTVELEPFEIELMRTHEVDGEDRETILYVGSPQSDVIAESPYYLFYCRLCPAAALTVTVPNLFSEGEATLSERIAKSGLKLGILAAVLVMMVFIARPFCRMMCPLGAIYSLFNRLAFVTMKLDFGTCNDCGLCDKACLLDLDVRKDLGGADCIQCGDCITACPQGSICRTVSLPGSTPEPSRAPAS
jgi:ferredoxin